MCCCFVAFTCINIYWKCNAIEQFSIEFGYDVCWFNRSYQKRYSVFSPLLFRIKTLFISFLSSVSPSCVSATHHAIKVHSLFLANPCKWTLLAQYPISSRLTGPFTLVLKFSCPFNWFFFASFALFFARCTLCVHVCLWKVASMRRLNACLCVFGILSS